MVVVADRRFARTSGPACAPATCCSRSTASRCEPGQAERSHRADARTRPARSVHLVRRRARTSPSRCASISSGPRCTCARCAPSRCPGHYGYVRITHFSDSTPRRFRRRRAGAPVAPESPLRGLVLDLRDNPGGVLESAVGVADSLLESGDDRAGRRPDRRSTLRARRDRGRPAAPVRRSSCWWTAARLPVRRSSPARCATTAAPR